MGLSSMPCLKMQRDVLLLKRQTLSERTDGELETSSGPDEGQTKESEEEEESQLDMEDYQ